MIYTYTYRPHHTYRQGLDFIKYSFLQYSNKSTYMYFQGQNTPTLSHTSPHYCFSKIKQFSNMDSLHPNQTTSLHITIYYTASQHTFTTSIALSHNNFSDTSILLESSKPLHPTFLHIRLKDSDNSLYYSTHLISHCYQKMFS